MGVRIVSLICLLGAGFFYLRGLSSDTFNRQYWLEHKNYDPFVRHRMLKDLMPQLVGKSSREVIDLLGMDEFHGLDRVLASKKVVQAPELCQMKYPLSHMQTSSKLPYLCIELVNGEVRSSQLIEY
jgi:hypothetical protein